MSSQERSSDMKAGRATGDELETYCKTDETNQRNNTGREGQNDERGEEFQKRKDITEVT